MKNVEKFLQEKRYSNGKIILTWSELSEVEEDDVVINACSVFGGIDILVPDGYKVKVKSNSLFGGVSNNKRSKTTEKSKTIFIDANCLFGGVTIK